MAALIDVAGLTKRYGHKRGIVDVSFQVSDGEVFGFLGPNGAGKTTTMRLLMALLFPDSGSARIAGLDCWRQSVEAKRVLGYLPGELALDPNLTGSQLLAYFANLRGGVERAYLEQLIERLELDTEPPVPSLFARQQAEGRPDSGLHAQAAPAHPRRADERPRSAEPARVRSHGGGGPQRRAHSLPLLARPFGSRVDLRSRGHRSRRPAGACRGVADLKNIRRRDVELTFVGAPAVDAFSGLAGVEAVETLPDGRTLRLTVQGDIDPVIKMAARYSLASVVCREPSLEDVFLRFYQEAAADRKGDADCGFVASS